MIRDGDNGFLVPVDDTDALVDRIERLLADDALRQRIVAQATADLVRFRWPTVVEEFESALRMILDERHEAPAVGAGGAVKVER